MGAEVAANLWAGPPKKRQMEQEHESTLAFAGLRIDSRFSPIFSSKRGPKLGERPAGGWFLPCGKAVMLRFSRGLSALSAAGVLACGFILGIAFLSLTNSAATPSLAQYIGAICANVLHSSPVGEAPFITENTDAMRKMMIDMEIRPTGDVDRDFVAMMVPHHQDAIDIGIFDALPRRQFGRDGR
jgi:hypothetical protein